MSLANWGPMAKIVLRGIYRGKIKNSGNSMPQCLSLSATKAKSKFGISRASPSYSIPFKSSKANLCQKLCLIESHISYLTLYFGLERRSQIWIFQIQIFHLALIFHPFNVGGEFGSFISNGQWENPMDQLETLQWEDF